MKNLNFALLLFTILTFAGCGDDDDTTIVGPVEFFNDGNYIFSYACEGDQIEFFIDVLADKTNSTQRPYPDRDFYRVYVDHNNNGVLDRDVDLVFSPLDDGRLCVSYLLTQTSITTCSFFDDATSETFFSATENETEEHINHRVRLPKDLLSNGATIKVSVQVYDASGSWTVLPDAAPLFDSAFEISW